MKRIMFVIFFGITFAFLMQSTYAQSQTITQFNTSLNYSNVTTINGLERYNYTYISIPQNASNNTHYFNNTVYIQGFDVCKHTISTSDYANHCAMEGLNNTNVTGLWHFNENGGLFADDDGRKNATGNITNGVFTSGLLGNAVYFNGTTNIHFGIWNKTGGEMDIFGEFGASDVDSTGMIDFWIKANTSTINTTIFSYYYSSSHYFHMTIGENYILFPNKITVQIKAQAPPCGSQNDRFVFNTTEILDDAWHRITLASNGSNYLAYIDDIPQTLHHLAGGDNGCWFADLTPRDYEFFMGENQTNGIDDFIGLIDEFMVLNKPIVNPPVYPYDLSLDIGNTGTSDYTFSGELNNTNTQQVTLSETAINTFLDSCSPDALGYCNLSINVSTAYGGTAFFNELNVTFKPINEVDLTISPSTSLSQGSVAVITCSVIEGSETLYRDGVTVTSPYTFTPTPATYNFTCASTSTANLHGESETQFLTVGSQATQCTNNLTFAFAKNLTVNTTGVISFNFTDLVNSHTIRNDLGDIYATNDVQLFKNETDGYYMVANVTGISNFSLQWGNYFVNRTYTTMAHANITSLSGYQELNQYYTFTIKDEISNSNTLPQNATLVTISMHCDSGSSTIEINDTTFLVSTFETSSDAQINVIYYSSQYSRSHILNVFTEHTDVFLADATTYTVYQIPIRMLDIGYANSRIGLYKLGAVGEIIITEGYFDSSNRFDTYLIKDERYFIRIIRGSETRDIGFLYAIEVGQVDISVSAVHLKPDISLINDHLTLSAEINNATDVLTIQYFDDLNQTSEIRIRVFEDINQTPFFDNTYSDTSNLTVTINNVNSSLRHNVNAEITHDTFGNSPVELNIAVGVLGFLFDLGIASWIYGGITLFLVTVASLIITPRIRFAGLIFMGALLGILYYAQWFQAVAGVLALIVVFIGLSVVYELRRGGDS